jgi:hypothetical protein
MSYQILIGDQSGIIDLFIYCLNGRTIILDRCSLSWHDTNLTRYSFILRSEVWSCEFQIFLIKEYQYFYNIAFLYWQ